MNLENYLELVSERLQNSFDLVRDYRLGDDIFDLYARYHLRNERYVLTKKISIYAFENNEYCLIRSFQALDQSSLEDFILSLKKSIDHIIQPNEEHMSSIITGVIVVNREPNQQLKDSIQGFKFHRGFAFGFKGWVDIRLLLVSLNDGCVITNKKGREVSKVYSIEAEHEKL